MEPARKLVLYIAASVDGYIAKTGDDLSFLSRVEKEGEDYGYARFMEGIDTVIIGRRTYDWVIGNMGITPHTDKRTYVITHDVRPAAGDTEFYAGDLIELVRRLKAVPGKDIFCDGGAEIIHQLLQADVVDELTISFIPVLLGAGVRLFKDGRPEQLLEHSHTQVFDTGLVQMHYRRKR